MTAPGWWSRWGGRQAALLALGVLALAGLLAAATRISVGGHWRGLYLLHQPGSPRLELKDDLLLGDAEVLVVGGSLDPLRRLAGLEPEAAAPPADGPGLALAWDERDGRGVVRNRLADGTELVTLLGRFRDSEGAAPQGLFVGGAAPDVSADLSRQDQSGMAFHDGRGWFHIWCNVNEAWVDGPSGRYLWPSSWRFLGSRVLERSARRVVLESRHEVEVTGGRLRMDRFAAFQAGERFFLLTVVLTALGPGEIRTTWLYGDEPWVGHFGSADGNVGWVEEGLLPFETTIDPSTHGWAGVYDRKSGFANYVGWAGGERPDDVYVSNVMGKAAPAEARVPLTSDEVFLGLQWRDRRQRAGEARSYRLAVGMADRDPATGLPRRPFGAP